MNPNNFVEPGLLLSVTYDRLHEGLNQDKAAVKKELGSTAFGNLLFCSQRTVQRQIKVDEKHLIKFRPLIGMYRKYSRIDLAQM